MDKSDKRRSCIRVGQTYALLSAFNEYAAERRDANTTFPTFERSAGIYRNMIQALVAIPVMPILKLGDWLLSISANRQFLRVCQRLRFNNSSIPKPDRSLLEARAKELGLSVASLVAGDRVPSHPLEILWEAYGLSEQRLHGCTMDDRVDCLCLWLDILYGEGAASRLNVRERVRQKLMAESAIMSAVGIGVHISFGDSVNEVMQEITDEHPACDWE